MDQPYIGTYIVQITDTFDDAAKAKIKSAYIKHTSEQGMRDVHISIIPAANSVIIGTEASELYNNTERPGRLIIAVNFAPPDRKEGTTNNARKDFFCADLGDNVSVCGTSNGLEFSYLKPQIQSLYRLTNTNSLGSQFRSLQILPKHAVLFSIPEQRERLIAEKILIRVEHIDDVVPSVPDITHVLQIDNFSNVKLVVSQNDRIMLQRLSETREPIYFAFGRGILSSELTHHFHLPLRRLYKAVASETLFHAPERTNVVAATSSSKLVGNQNVPIIATLRGNPAETKPAYTVPKVGFSVSLSEARPKFLGLDCWLERNPSFHL